MKIDTLSTEPFTEQVEKIILKNTITLLVFYTHEYYLGVLLSRFHWNALLILLIKQALLII